MSTNAFHNALLDMLLIIDNICQKHEIPYQLAAGTLLGAVRDQKIIDWDNDADVCMLRADYERFMAVAEKELDDRFFLQHHKSETHMYSLVSKLRLNGSRRYRPGRAVNSFVHEGISVDIFAFDEVKPELIAGKLHMTLCALFKHLLTLRSFGDQQLIWKAHRPWFVKILAWLFYQPLRLPSKSRLMYWNYCIVTWYSMEKELSRVSSNSSKFVTCLVSLPLSAKRRYPRIRKKSDFEQLTLGSLNGHIFPIPHNFHEVLTNLYGDYMSPLPEYKRDTQMLVQFNQSTGIDSKPDQSSDLIRSCK